MEEASSRIGLLLADMASAFIAGIACKKLSGSTDVISGIQSSTEVASHFPPDQIIEKHMRIQ
jgi:hypothetical protein